MTQFILSVFSTIFGNNVVLATIFISMIPVIELKGAIPFSMSSEIWGANALSLWPSFFWAVLGSSLIVFVLALIYIPLIKWLKSTKILKKIALKIEKKVNKRKEIIEENIEEVKIAKKSKNVYNKKFFLKILGVFAFVAIPLPFTGVWSGTCLAVALGLGFWWSCLTVIVANVVAGLLVSGVSALFPNSTLMIFYILILIIIVFFVGVTIKKIVNKTRKKGAK